MAAQPSTRVLILTTFGLDDYVYDALRAGASGFMLKDAPPEEIAAAVRFVASGDALLAPAVTRCRSSACGTASRPSSTPTKPASSRHPRDHLGTFGLLRLVLWARSFKQAP